MRTSAVSAFMSGQSHLAILADCMASDPPDSDEIGSLLNQLRLMEELLKRPSTQDSSGASPIERLRSALDSYHNLIDRAIDDANTPRIALSLRLRCVGWIARLVYGACVAGNTMGLECGSLAAATADMLAATIPPRNVSRLALVR